MIYLKIIVVIYSILLIFFIHKYNRYKTLLRDSLTNQMGGIILIDRMDRALNYLKEEMSLVATKEDNQIHLDIVDSIIEGNDSLG